MFFRALLECLLVSEEDETRKYILGFCFPIVLAATGRPPRKQGGDGEVDELGRQVAGTGAGLQSALPSQQKNEKKR